MQHHRSRSLSRVTARAKFTIVLVRLLAPIRSIGGCLSCVGRPALAAVGFGMLLPAATAGTILYEGFDYSTGSISGQNGGTGFSGAWTVADGEANVSVASPGLTSGNLTTSGNLLLGTQSLAISRPFDSSGLTRDGSTYWFSVLFSAPDTTTGSASALPSFFSNLISPYAQAQGFAFAFNPTSSTSAYLDIRIGGAVLANTNVTSANYYAETHLFLGRITFSGTANQDKIELWMDPSLDSSEATLGSPLLGAFGQWNDAGSNNAFRYNKYDGPDRAFDEIRLATTLGDALPSAIPEPAAGPVVAGLAAILIAAYDFRRRAQKELRPSSSAKVDRWFGGSGKREK